MTSSYTPGTPALDPTISEKMSDAEPSDMLAELLATVGFLTNTIRDASSQLEVTLARVSRVTGIESDNVVSRHPGGFHEDQAQ